MGNGLLPEHTCLAFQLQLNFFSSLENCGLVRNVERVLYFGTCISGLEEKPKGTSGLQQGHLTSTPTFSGCVPPRISRQIFVEDLI